LLEMLSAEMYMKSFRFWEKIKIEFVGNRRGIEFDIYATHWHSGTGCWQAGR